MYSVYLDYIYKHCVAGGMSVRHDTPYGIAQFRKTVWHSGSIPGLREPEPGPFDDRTAGAGCCQAAAGICCRRRHDCQTCRPLWHTSNESYRRCSCAILGCKVFRVVLSGRDDVYRRSSDSSQCGVLLRILTVAIQWQRNPGVGLWADHSRSGETEGVRAGGSTNTPDEEPTVHPSIRRGRPAYTTSSLGATFYLEANTRVKVMSSVPGNIVYSPCSSYFGLYLV